MPENVKKIRELADFNVNTEISRDDLLIVATGPDTRRDSEGNADPISAQTLKVTIEAIITAYNKSLIPPSGGGSTTDPSDRPNAEVPKDGGGTYFQDTTPFSAANLDVMIKSGCGIDVVEECHNASEVSVDCSSADLKYKTKKLCLSNIPSSALNITAGSIPMSALDTTSGTIPASAVANPTAGSVDPAALSLDTGDDFEIDSNGNLKLKDGVAQAPGSGGSGSSGGVSTPVNGNLIATGGHTTGTDTSFNITQKGGSASDVWGVFTVNNGGNNPNHQVWTFHDSSFTAGNNVADNHSSANQGTTFQFLAPVDSSGKCYIRNIETGSNAWQVYYMGSIGAGGGSGASESDFFDNTPLSSAPTESWTRISAGTFLAKNQSTERNAGGGHMGVQAMDGSQGGAMFGLISDSTGTNDKFNTIYFRDNSRKVGEVNASKAKRMGINMGMAGDHFNLGWIGSVQSGSDSEAIFNSTRNITSGAVTTTFPGILDAVSVSSSIKNFKIKHPIKPETHWLYHCAIEGPEANTLYRGKATLVNGSAEINIDSVSNMTEGTFIALNTNNQCFTNNESNWDLVRGSINGNILTIESQNSDSTAEVSWMVIGERHDDFMKNDNENADSNGKITPEVEITEEEASPNADWAKIEGID
jgi:hypothetical protein